MPWIKPLTEVIGLPKRKENQVRLHVPVWFLRAAQCARCCIEPKETISLLVNRPYPHHSEGTSCVLFGITMFLKWQVTEWLWVQWELQQIFWFNTWTMLQPKFTSNFLHSRFKKNSISFQVSLNKLHFFFISNLSVWFGSSARYFCIMCDNFIRPMQI